MLLLAVRQSVGDTSPGILSFMDGHMLTFVSCIITGFLTFLASILANKSQEKSALIEHYLPSWKQYTEELSQRYELVIEELKEESREAEKAYIKNLSAIRQQHSTEMKKRNQEMECMRARMESLEQTMKDTKSRVKEITDKYTTALKYIKEVTSSETTLLKRYPYPLSIEGDLR